MGGGVCPAAQRPASLLTFTLSGLDHGDMMEMQGFGGSPSSWQQAEVSTQEALCLSCSTAASNVSFDYPASCTCIHDQPDIHTYVNRMNLKVIVSWFGSWIVFVCVAIRAFNNSCCVSLPAVFLWRCSARTWRGRSSPELFMDASIYLLAQPQGTSVYPSVLSSSPVALFNLTALYQK